MISAAEANPTDLKDLDQMKPASHQSGTMDSNHDGDLTARSVKEIDNHFATEKDDAATMAASEELKHTTISDDPHVSSTLYPSAKRFDPPGEDKDVTDKIRESTPETEPGDALDEQMKEKLSSPKKKRGRDTYDEMKELEGDYIDKTGPSADGSAVNGDRLEMEGPEKKRHRDTSEDPLKFSGKIAEAKETSSSDPADTSKTTSTNTQTSQSSLSSSPKPNFGSVLSQKPQTSASAFANSGFSSLASSSTSPFGTIDASKPGVFGGNAHSAKASFSSLGGATPSSTSTMTTSGFGVLSGDTFTSGFGFGSTSTSGFGALGSGSVFGSALGNGFSGGSGPKLSSFAAPGKEVALASKPAKAFGAPESDEEDGGDDEGSDGCADLDEEKDTTDEKKKFKIAKAAAHVEDGESGEATLLQLRAKLFALESKEAGWKERGVGTLKINVPKPCVSFDENGVAIPGSFDASGLEEEGEDESSSPRCPRLIMRQENTHRVILNTIIVRAMEFIDKPSTTAAQIMFTAFEGEKDLRPVNMLFKMNEANARSFRSEIASIQREL